MAEPFLGEIRLFGFGFPPSGWATCDGQIMQVGQNQALYALLGTTYGGNGSTTFNLPDFRGRTMLHASPTYLEGRAGGAEKVALTAPSELPVHTHALSATSVPGTTNVPQGNFMAAVADATKFAYADAKASPPTSLGINTIAPAGASQGHNNMQPSLTVNFCIALQGLWPSRN